MGVRERISVIVPSYNSAKTLAGCLGALYASDYPYFEVIVVDDGSTDETPQIAVAYPCHVLSLPENRGAAQAKNEGAVVASGTILFFTDADVYVRPDTLTRVSEDLQDPSVSGVVGLLAQDCPHPNFASQFKNLWMHFTYRRQPRRVGLFFTSVAAIRRDVFLREGGFDSRYRGASITEDIEFGQRLLRKGYYVMMDQRLTVQHDKHYTLRQVLHTDLLRARGLTQTWIRNHLSGGTGAHYASVPWFFGAAVFALGLATLFLVLTMISRDMRFFWMAAGCTAIGLVLNGPFLIALGRWRGPVFLLQSLIFLLVDLYVSGLGIAVGFYDLARRKSY